jgi:hypothetical protein
MRSVRRVVVRGALRVVSGVFARLFRFVPRGRRFAVVARVVLVTLPLWRAAPSFRRLMRTFGWNGERDAALRIALGSLSRRGIPFDPPFVAHDGELLNEALRAGKGTLVVGTHRALNIMTMRYLHSLGVLPAVVGMKDMNVAGTDVPLPVIRRGVTCLVRARTHLRRGGVVCAAIDHEQSGRRTLPVRLASATLEVSEALLLVAARCGAEVRFVATELGDDGKLHIYFGAPPEVRPAEMHGEFSRFVVSLEQAMLGGAGAAEAGGTMRAGYAPPA